MSRRPTKRSASVRRRRRRAISTRIRSWSRAQATGAEAIHPGYGFLSENAAFAEACEAAGIAFIGPTPRQMRDFGLKHTARELAHGNGVPLLPGTGLLDDLDQARREAQRIGYPVMLKSTAGGGGIGMQLCWSEQEAGEAFHSVERLARNNFGQGGIFLEKYVEVARHIEVQIFGDGAGQVVALGERDCSVQRRNQKVIEETPAPGLTDASARSSMEAAVRLGEAVQLPLRGHGGVRLRRRQRRRSYFLEVNTRLQVEHGVTEEVTGVDLVEWMVRTAAGEPPPLRGVPCTSPTGMPIQVRLYAEDPGKNFQPSSGLLTEVRFPTIVRVDTWVETGSEVLALLRPDDRQDHLPCADARAGRSAHAERRAAARRVSTASRPISPICGRSSTTPVFRRRPSSTRAISASCTYQAPTIDVLHAGHADDGAGLSRPHRVTGTSAFRRPGPWTTWPSVSPTASSAIRQGTAGLELTVTGPTLNSIPPP